MKWSLSLFYYFYVCARSSRSFDASKARSNGGKKTDGELAATARIDD